MAAPTIQFAYLTRDRVHIVVVCRVDHGRTPLKVISGLAETGWTVKFNGTPQVGFTATVANPQPNTVNILLDAGPLITDTVTISYNSAVGEIADINNVELVTVLDVNAITVFECLPIIDLIARDIKMRLTDITTANGFLFNLSVVDDLKQPVTVAESKAVVAYDDPATEDEAPIMHEQFTAMFHIYIDTAISTTSTTPLSSKEFQMEAEVIKYLLVEYQRNNLAVDTVPQAPSRIEFGDGGWGGIAVNLLLRFRTLYGNRFEQ